MAEKMLSPFKIRNLKSSNQSSGRQDGLVRISAPGYDGTMSNNPTAGLKYRDEEDDIITLGSSRELIEKLGDPVVQTRGSSPQRNKDRMSIAMLLSEAQQDPEALKHHVFDIDEREEIQRLWQEIQQRNKTPPPTPTSKKPAGWSPDEDSLLIRLRNEGLRWEEIARRIEGHTPISCRLHYQLLEYESRQQDEKKNKLAVAYERLRRDIWSPIAAELGDSWNEVETMSWALGQDEIRRRARAHQLLFSENDHSHDFISVKSTDGDWHEDRRPKATSYFQIPIRNSDDYRVHHFNLTMPPQLKSYKPANPALNANPTQSKRAGASLPSMEVESNPAAKLTIEGKRQAQAAGDILRARTMSSRHRKGVMSAMEHSTHRNRWADYKSSDSAFAPKPSKPMSQGFEKPSPPSEGRRQAQAAGDKLRCRTNPIRHSRSSRSGSLEHGVTKNRWSSFVAPRVARSDEQHRADTESSAKSRPEDIEPQTMDQQSTLLEVFEAELAKDPSVVNNVLDSTRFPDPEISAIPSFAARSIPSANSLSKNVAAGQNAQAPQQVNPRLGGFKMISDYLHGFTAGDVEAAQELSQVIDHGVRTAAGGFDALLRRLTGSLEEASGRSQQAADRTREVDTQGIDDTIKGLRDFVACLTAGLKIPENDGKKDLKKESTKMDSAVIPARSMDNVTAGSSSDRVSAPPDGMSTGPTSCLQHETMDIDTNAKVKRPNSCDPLLSNPQARPDTVSLLYTLPQQYSSTSYEDTTSGPRYHKPGPIHLPHHTTMSSSASDNTDCVPLAGPRNRESERGFFSSTAYVDHFPGSRATSPPPAASRFPTLAQFEEGQNFAGAPSFPALPSMEPLVPRRVDGQSAGTVDDEPSNPVFDVTGSSQKSLEHNKLDPAVLAKDLLISNGIDPANLVPQFTSFMEQNPAVQQKSIQVYADNRAQRCPEPPKVVQPFMAKQEGPHVRTSDLVNQACDTKREFEEGHGKKSLLLGRQEAGLRYQNHRKNSEQPIDYSLQLKLLEQQNKKRLLLARQETESAYRPNEEKSEAEKDYEMQLTLLEQQKKKHQIMARNEAELRHQADQKESDQKQDYQMQLMLLEQQNKKRLLMARQEAEPVKSLDHESDAALLDRQLKSRLEQQSKKRIQMARPEQDTVSDGPKLPLVFSLETRPNNQTNEARLSNPFNAADDGIEQDSEQDTRPNSAARLVEPFDPLDVEPSARLHLTEGVRRNATVAGTSSRHNAPRRRPYSEAYDGFGRLGWESFLGGSHDEDHDSLRHPGTNLSRRQEHARKMRGSRGSGRYQRKQDQLRRSTTLHDTMPMSTPSFRRYDDEHQDDTTVAAINGCVNQLKDLGFGSDDDASGSRLLVYAQAAGGDLVEAIDMIDEEQRAYKERF